MTLRSVRVVIVLFAWIIVAATSAFTAAPTLSVRTTTTGGGLKLNSANNEKLPETSFGADVVPEGQRPVNEYLDLIRAPLFGWASEETGTKGLVTRLAAVYTVSFIAVCFPISGATFTQDGYLLQQMAASNVGALLLTLFLCIRLYSGWGYVGSRLKSRVIEYEETGWYDGDFEEKTPAERQRDLFLYQSNVEPVVNRLKTVSLAVAALWVASCIGFNAAMNSKPLFDNYDPTMLERLRYDEKLAGKVSEESAGRPTYCDSRYYRAVANGGQGCD
mmetsp:Transcript_18720/g.32002  ORF Transcript_18720/g.32002 Transcript_18720/m.32002 type:complete len:275 (+) Transcript_18720:90-914(+)|eukprot:CAMPEP_0116564742 /NCGR_PEP_ID=MMETSP0397-20121206/13499_1 /TAXON_ID=216820 /ORGANISM="Cyclophora tenuis, Strain ECT3854" /LENGTH=274 /DNA_ID=CAMNT_0004091413 /DNA_START=13 /DNA_END=837 /DNA_ORIENTATION=+